MILKREGRGSVDGLTLLPDVKRQKNELFRAAVFEALEAGSEEEMMARDPPPMPSVKTAARGNGAGRVLQRPIVAGAPSKKMVKVEAKRRELSKKKVNIKAGERSKLESEAWADTTKKDYERTLEHFDIYCKE